MSTEEELKWMTKRYSWRYIPFRYQSTVAMIIAALLYVNAFNAYFTPAVASSGDCGSVFRPVVSRGISDEQAARDAVTELFGGTPTGKESVVVGLPWDSFSSIFTLNQQLNCPRRIQGKWWEMFASFSGIAFCGVVLRRSIKREDGTEPVLETPIAITMTTCPNCSTSIATTAKICKNCRIDL